MRALEWERAGYIRWDEMCKYFGVLACQLWESCLTCCQSIQCRAWGFGLLLWQAAGCRPPPPTPAFPRDSLWLRSWSWHCRSRAGAGTDPRTSSLAASLNTCVWIHLTRHCRAHPKKHGQHTESDGSHANRWIPVCSDKVHNKCLFNRHLAAS